MPILNSYKEWLARELRANGLDSEKGLGREMVKQFEMTFELHDRVAVLERAEKDKKADV